ncbi:TrbL/VirB6 family protein [Rhizorhabdus sp. FW153]|uniref:type IV secretion system protein n=1 Tax=Rhizorhabdus sp. FW153 TaxID=3400216 RepID=UPI003CEB86E5
MTALTSFVDCHVLTLGKEGYLALAGSNSPVTIAIGGLIAILIALFGYRLILDDDVRLRDGVLLFVRIGFVLALATQWSAYQAVVYDFVIKTPGEISSAILRSEQSQIDDLPARIQASYDTLENIIHPPLPDGDAAGQTETSISRSSRVLLSATEQGRLSASSVILLLSTLGAILSVRLVMGTMLAIGPIFLACFLFHGLRGFFEGWIRVLFGSVLGSIATTIVIEFELAVLQPQLEHLYSSMAIEKMPRTAALEIFASVLLFSVVLIAALVAGMRAAAGFRMPSPLASQRPHRVLPSSTNDLTSRAVTRPANDNRGNKVIPSTSVRYGPINNEGASNSIENIRQIVIRTREADRLERPNFEPLGRSHRPRLGSRQSFSARRRDRSQ